MMAGRGETGPGDGRRWAALLRRFHRDERGAVLVLVALSAAALVSVVALAVDVGMLFVARAEAQRAADAGALAGASAFLVATGAERDALAEARAVDYATRNSMLRTPIEADEVTVDLLASSAGTLRVRATVRRPEVRTFFAAVFGVHTVPVAASAEAEALQSARADCLKPFAIPDNAYTEEDFGELVMIWQVGHDDHVLVGYNDNQPPGLGEIRTSISSTCIAGQSAALEDELLWEKPSSAQGHSGDGVGQVMNGMNDLLASDPYLAYDEPTESFNRLDWESSPRVGRVVLYDRDQYNNGTGQVRVTNFATVYFSHTTGRAGNPNNPYTVWGRIFPAQGLPGSCPGGVCSENTFRIRLVK
jgi:Flp pilus assembly protein TadG